MFSGKDENSAAASAGSGRLPWDFQCALKSQYGTDQANEDLKLYPLLYEMPKTTLSIEESDELDEYTRLFYDDIWRKGLKSDFLDDGSLRGSYYELGREILSDEGFSAFYQGLTIT